MCDKLSRTWWLHRQPDSRLSADTCNVQCVCLLDENASSQEIRGGQDGADVSHEMKEGETSLPACFPQPPFLSSAAPLIVFGMCGISSSPSSRPAFIFVSSPTARFARKAQCNNS